MRRLHLDTVAVPLAQNVLTHIRYLYYLLCIYIYIYIPRYKRTYGRRMIETAIVIVYNLQLPLADTEYLYINNTYIYIYVFDIIGVLWERENDDNSRLWTLYIFCIGNNNNGGDFFPTSSCSPADQRTRRNDSVIFSSSLFTPRKLLMPDAHACL